MNALPALLVAQHLEDLLREADAERRLRLLRGAESKPALRFFGVGRRIESIVNRIRATVSRSIRPRPARA